MERMRTKRAWEYGIYILILMGCIIGIYWRFWYRPSVHPVVVIDSKSLRPSTEMLPQPMLDPDFRWNLTRTDKQSLLAYFQEEGQGRTIPLGLGETLGGWQLKGVDESMVVMTKKGDERAVYLQSISADGK